jgi:transcriptional regulator with XRE-family HTH domain
MRKANHRYDWLCQVGGMQVKSRDLGRKLCELRHALGFSGPELCKKLEINQPQLSRLENGLQGFRDETLKSFCDVLGVPPIYFFVENQEVFTSKVAEELLAAGLRPTQGLRKALANAAFLRFLEACAKEADHDDGALDRMDDAARGAAWFPPKW